MTPIRWSPQAVRDVEAIRDYIAQDSQRYAQLTVDRIIASVERLRAFPQSGRVVPERADPDIREVIAGPSAWSTATGRASSTSPRCFEDRGCSRTSSRRRPNKGLDPALGGPGYWEP